MSRFLCAGGVADWRCSKIVGTIAVGLIMPLAAIWVTQKSPARAGGLEPRSGDQQTSAVPADRDRFVSEIQRRLKVCRERIAAIGPLVLATVDDLNRVRDELTNQRIAEESAKADFGNAELTRQVAEIAIVEYEEGIFKEDEAKAEGELKLAESDLARAQDAVETTKERLATIRKVSRGNASDVAVEYTYEDFVTDAERRVPKVRLAVEQAQTKLRMLRQYIKSKAIKERQSEVEKSRADELTKKVAWVQAKAKLDRLDARENKLTSEVSNASPLSVLARALSVDEKIRAELAELKKNAATDEYRAQKITNLLSELEGLVSQAESELARARVDRLKAAIHDAVARFAGPKP
jgi:hypothetical protein